MDPETLHTHRDVLRGLVLAREEHCRREKSRLLAAPYAFALLAGQTTGFQVVTLRSSLGCAYGEIPGARPVSGLTAGMTAALSRVALYVMGSTVAVVDPPEPTLPFYQLVTKLTACLLVYPPGVRSRASSPHASFVVDILPHELAAEPLYVVAVRRPDGWPR